MTENLSDQPRQFKGKGFQKRFYNSWSAFWKDLTFLFSNRNRIKSAMRSDQLTRAFRERLMLAVTEVNHCRYCRSFHVQQAYQAGISKEEVQTYLEGAIPEDVPDDQKIAVAYARHWAENETRPDLAFENQLREFYGENGFLDIGMVLRMIWMGNLLGNTLDYLLYLLSFGKRRA